MQTAILVPARLASTRFPKKLLYPIKGKSLIVHVAERIRQQAPEFPLVFAIDDVNLEREIRSHGFESIMTNPDHVSGTDRLAEANRHLGAKFVVNIQGDEPLVTRDQIIKLVEMLHSGAPMATLATTFSTTADFKDPNQVKVVLSNENNALYFSRAPVPYMRDNNGKPSDYDIKQNFCYRHLGMYAYQADFLDKFSSLPQGHLEELEKLEQLRALENGYSIAVAITSDPSIGVDTIEDAALYEALL